MPPIIPDAPWWVNALVIMVAVTIAPVVTYLATRSRLEATQEDVKEVRSQVQNTHKSNLRDDLDALAKGQRRGYERLERYIADVSADVSSLRRSEDRRDKRHDQALAEAVADRQHDIEEVRAEISDAIREHVKQCHARNQPKEK